MEKVKKPSDALICVSSYHREARLLAVALLLTPYAEQWRQQQNYKEAVTALILLNKHFWTRTSNIWIKQFVNNTVCQI